MEKYLQNCQLKKIIWEINLIQKGSGKACFYFSSSLLVAQSIVGNSFGRNLQYINLETKEYNEKTKYLVRVNIGIKFSGATFKY